MKHFYAIIAVLLLLHYSETANAGSRNIFFAVDTLSKKVDTTKRTNILEVQPQYPGGDKALARYITNKLEYPEVARLIGISGKVYVQFIVERDGSITNVTPINCVGAGCESEAAKVISMSKPWSPGLQNNKPVRVQYTVPISFSISKDHVAMRALRNSDYGFIFEINDVTYTIEEAEKILGKTISPAQIEMAYLYYNEQKYPMPNKKEIYLLKMKAQPQQ